MGKRSSSPNSPSPPNSPPAKRLKTEIPDSGEETNNSVSINGSCCGICLCDDGNVIRGKIDSCDHFFCFVCIMEWAKVESRCPTCKRRFTTIRRLPVHGSFAYERVVNIPRRDQIFHVLGNATMEHFDPYAQVQCSVCCTAEDECLLLLCDLCDSAAHTYCVGLGATVPEGDWFCHDCSISRTEHDNLQKENEDESETHNDGLMNQANVSILDIIRDADDHVTNRRRTRSSVETSPRETQSNLAGDMSSPMPLTEARTLSRCRNVQGYVRTLRENWDALRSGSLRFEPSGRTKDRSSQLQSSSSTTGQKRARDKHSDDTEKAWEMMGKAKLVQHASKRNKTVHCVPKHACTTANARGGSSRLTVSRDQWVETSGLGNSKVEKLYEFFTPEKKVEKHEYALLKIQNISTRASASTSSQNMQNNSAGSCCHTEEETILQKSLRIASLKVKNRQHESGHQMPLVGSASTTSESANTRTVFGASFSSKCLVPGRDLRLEKGHTNRKAANDGAKSEILDLVKLNLSLLKGDKQLGKDVYKEVARLATHTILAACGFEHSKHIFHTIPKSVCDHFEHSRQFHKSTLMPNSCRGCFYGFVKEVVNSILSKKIG